MSDRRYPRPRSPPIHHHARASLPIVHLNYAPSYGSDLHAVPTSRREFTGAAQHNPVVTTYKITPEVPSRSSSTRNSSRSRSSTLEPVSRPTIITNASPRRPAFQPGRPVSPIQNPYRSSEEGEFYTIPASSSDRHRPSRHRPSYSATLDNSDMHKLARDIGSDRYLRPSSGREGAVYPQAKPRSVYPSALVRHPDTVADDYGDDGYGYTNPRDLVQYDLNRTARPPPKRRDSYEGSRPARPSSITGYVDLTPRAGDPRERGPPPSTRGFDKISNRSSMYEVPPPPTPVRAPVAPVEIVVRPSSVKPVYDDRTSRRPVSVYQDVERHRPTRDRDEYYDTREEDLRDRRKEKHYHSDRRDESLDMRGLRSERERNDYEKKKDYDRAYDYDRNDEIDTRHDRRSERDDKHRSGRDTLATGLSLAGAALGIGALTKNEKEDDREERDGHRRRRDEEPRRRRDPRDDRDTAELSGREGRERYLPRDERESLENGGEMRERSRRDENPEVVDLMGRNPQERRPREDRDMREETSEYKERRKQRSDTAANITPPDSRSESSDEPSGRRALRARRLTDTPAQPFNPKDTMDLRSLKEALNRQDAPVPVSVLANESARDSAARQPLREMPQEPGEPARDSVGEALAREPARQSLREIPREPIREPVREASVRESNRDQAFDPRDARDLSNIQAELREIEERGRRDVAVVRQDEHRPVPRLVSPPRDESGKSPTSAQPVKGILRQPREKFPEDPVPIREGVAPLKDAKKDGVPPDARWTKISRRMVNPEALEAGKERYEAREDFVIVLRVLSKEEIQGYAEVTQRIRAAREEEEADVHHRRRRERHQRHKRERYHRDREDDGHDAEHRSHRREREGSHSESDTTSDEDSALKAHEAPRTRRITFEEELRPDAGNLREDPDNRGTYTGYMRNPPPLGARK